MSCPAGQASLAGVGRFLGAKPPALWQHLDHNKNRETARMRHAAPEGDEREALPTDGMDVQEVRDTDSLRLFIAEWHRNFLRPAAEPAPEGDAPPTTVA
jgi:hypothetical protein